MTNRTRERFDSGFKNLRDVLISCLGAYGFWFQVTRVAEPQPFVLVVCGLLMAAPGILTLLRTNGNGTSKALEDTIEEAVRRVVGEQVEKKAHDDKETR